VEIDYFFQIKCVFAELNTNIEKSLVLGQGLQLIKKNRLFSLQRFVSEKTKSITLGYSG